MERLVKLVLAARNRKKRACDQFDAYEGELIRQLTAAKIKSLEQDGYRLRLVRQPVVSCRSCGHDLGTPIWVLPGFEPQRLEIKKA